MPRGVKKPGNQHNSRHENGVVAPGKRITKQKSNGHLNGSAEGASHANGAPVSSTLHPITRTPDKRRSGTPHTFKDDPRIGETQDERASEDYSDGLPNGTSHANGTFEHTHRKIDVNAAKNPMVHDSSIWHLAYTILRSCPLGDTIAILIVLLWLPPTLLTITHTLFAILTFIMPPGAYSMPTTFHEIFQGSGGTPSLATIFLTDVIGLILWLVMWNPVQTLSIELAQAVVATTLGGSTAGKKKGSDRTLLCMSIVTASHVARHQWIPHRLFGYDWSAILSSIPYGTDAPSFFSGSDVRLSRSYVEWFRILLALHILVQGLVRVARRWYQKRDYAQTTPASRKTDPEAIVGSPARPIGALPPEVSASGTTLSPDASLKLPAAIAKERDKISTGKKKRKQSTFVRTQQPLWAAFAQTKVTVLREYEQSHKQSETMGSGATDPSNLGSASFSNEDGCVWVSHVLPTSFRFDTSYFAAPNESGTDGEKHTITASVGIDRSKPLYVRINDTDWTSTTIEQSDLMDENADGRWTGEVFGLTPSSSYKCSFVQSEDGMVFHSATVTTPPSIAADKDPNLSSTAAPHRAHRPSSPKTPTTTLKDSIQAFEASLNESQARQKRSKKDNRANSIALKKDIDVFSSKISKLIGEDKAHVNRHLQWNQHTRQADEAVNSLLADIESLGYIPEEDLTLSRDQKAEWDEARDQQSLTREDLDQCKWSSQRERSAIQNEATSTQQKRERLLSRKNKLCDQHEKLESVTSQGLDEKERKNFEQAARDLERLQHEQRGHEQLAHCQRLVQDSLYSKQQTWHQSQILESAFQEQQVVSNSNNERPITPEGDLPGTVPQHSAALAFRYPAFGSPDQPSNLRSHSGSLRHNDHRPRSTSLLSGNSIYADFEDEDPAPPMPARAVEVIRERGRKRSGGSGSGSSGSQRDPASPVIGNVIQMSPVGKRSPVWN